MTAEGHSTSLPKWSTNAHVLAFSSRTPYGYCYSRTCFVQSFFSFSSGPSQADRLLCIFKSHGLSREVWPTEERSNMHYTFTEPLVSTVLPEFCRLLEITNPWCSLFVFVFVLDTGDITHGLKYPRQAVSNQAVSLALKAMTQVVASSLQGQGQ